mgnify:CR=1 FL=1
MADIGRVTISAMKPCTLLAPFANNRTLNEGPVVFIIFFPRGDPDSMVVSRGAVTLYMLPSYTEIVSGLPGFVVLL